MLYIVVPTYDREKIFYDFIRQLEMQTVKDYRLIVVDHGLKKTNYRNEQTVVIESSVNGWTYAINLGIRYVLEKEDVSIEDHIMVINDDVLMENDYLEMTLKAISENPNSCIGSCCYDWNTLETLHVNMIFNKLKASFEYHNKGIALKELKFPYYASDVLKGRGTVWPIKVLKEIGIYNEKKLPHYRADHELAWRAKRSGYNVCVSKNMVLGAVLDSPHKIDKEKGVWENYNNIFKNMISVKNTKDLWNYAFCSFGIPYALYFFGVNWLRYHIFFIVDYMKEK